MSVLSHADIAAVTSDYSKPSGPGSNPSPRYVTLFFPSIVKLFSDAQADYETAVEESQGFEEKYFNELAVDPDIEDFFNSSQFEDDLQNMGSEFSFANDENFFKKQC